MTPPLLRKMSEARVGDLVVRKDRIYEPQTGLRVAHSFPTHEAAVAAARAMNEVADWFGVIKTRAEGRLPNCMDELRRIISEHGGTIADGGGIAPEAICADTVSRIERR
jgi:hypothetical protein